MIRINSHFTSESLTSFSVMGVEVDVGPCWNKLELPKNLKNLPAISQLCSLNSLRDLSGGWWSLSRIYILY